MEDVENLGKNSDWEIEEEITIFFLNFLPLPFCLHTIYTLLATPHTYTQLKATPY